MQQGILFVKIIWKSLKTNGPLHPSTIKTKETDRKKEEKESGKERNSKLWRTGKI